MLLFDIFVKIPKHQILNEITHLYFLVIKKSVIYIIRMNNDLLPMCEKKFTYVLASNKTFRHDLQY